ncbi:mRNA interferase [Pseudomonas fluorescens]|uniref:mRNA interferase n=1 Tax=Pseudomonas fluorescens TaxID=294 RepID=A0A165YIK3_PSEFL|nr:mRNA interferase [Pseudomonas fluorescens]
MKLSELRRWLKTQRMAFEAGKGSHFKVPPRQQGYLADHSSKEKPEPTGKAIIKQLGSEEPFHHA